MSKQSGNSAPLLLHDDDEALWVQIPVGLEEIFFFIFFCFSLFLVGILILQT
jgi:hypothetical protein